MKTKSQIPQNRLTQSNRSNFNPIRTLKPNTLSRILDNFHSGNLKTAAQIWDAIERRDDVLQGVISKRKKSISRLRWEIITLDNSPEALLHKRALEHFYNNITTTHACSSNEQGGLSLLIKQMMDSVGKKYAVHEVIFNTSKHHQKQLTATFKFIPLWFFKHKSGELQFLESDSNSKGQSLKPGSWLVTQGEGIMEASSIAYLFKHLPLRDWLIYCERNGMPGVKGTTDALPGTQEWEAARDAVMDFGSEFHALMNRGTDIQPIDLSTKGTLPYPELIERMDRAMVSLWRGNDLSTFSKENATGSSIQSEESTLIESDDAATISETLNIQIDRVILKNLFGANKGKAYFKLIPRDTRNLQKELDLLKDLLNMGLPLSPKAIIEQFNIPTPQKEETPLTLK